MILVINVVNILRDRRENGAYALEYLDVLFFVKVDIRPTVGCVAHSDKKLYVVFAAHFVQLCKIIVSAGRALDICGVRSRHMGYGVTVVLVKSNLECIAHDKVFDTHEFPFRDFLLPSRVAPA